MDRLQKKCVFASAGIHLLLLLILLVGPAFMASRSKPDTMPVLDFVALKTVDDAMSGGGNPNAKPPPATMEKPQPTPAAPIVNPTPPPPEKVQPPEPRKETVKEAPPRRGSGIFAGAEQRAQAEEADHRPQAGHTPLPGRQERSQGGGSGPGRGAAGDAAAPPHGGCVWQRGGQLGSKASPASRPSS